MTTPEQPFTLTIPDAELELLHKKLELTRFPDELEGAGWDYGVPLAHVKRLVARWTDGFDWRASEAAINTVPQFTRDINVEGFGTLNIHYVHQKSDLDSAIPLLFVHGWPGHFLEVTKLLPLLTTVSPEFPSFHVVTYSLPGFGFSEAPKSKGFTSKQYAEVGHKLMLTLGYNEYVTQGGDWGFLITRRIAQLYGGSYCKACHTNFLPLIAPPPFKSNPGLFLKYLTTPYTPLEREGLKRTEWFLTKGRGYEAGQSTYPQTIGYSLADSPIGLLAWIYEKLVLWSDDYSWTDDEILTWVSIYWFSRSGPAASLRIYYEATPEYFKPTPWSATPYGISLFPKDLIRVPKLWAHSVGNLVFAAEHEKGGHFASHETPEVLAGDLRKMFGKGGPAYGVVPGKSGYIA
ncbi:unnamed protein product [Somion occarium]|uniref:Epoxide hydrolase N-terminal domain-containing protein n=1 Tax=Somion occarium TaxID=3059160 RepID=A0ABP1E1L1_9APHY